SWAVVLLRDGDQLRKAAQAGSEAAPGEFAVDAPVVAQVLETAAPALIEQVDDRLGDLPAHTGAAAVLPLRAGTTVTGLLLAVRDKDSAPFGADLMPLLASFADQAVVALEFAENQQAKRLVDVLEDRDRIARDLHDHVIQRLFATGMSLQGSLTWVTHPEARRRVQKAVNQLDQTVLEIRTSIFDLQADSGDTGLRRRLLNLVAEITEGAELSPAIRMSGTIDSLVPEYIGEHAEAVVRETVTNALRHARATELTLTVEAGDALIITMVDNGLGMPPEVARSGLRNLEQRASELNGALTVADEPGGGTRVTWRVPLD
ncbi:MAG TPA: ATP-binding protein, partial [Lentzea sp.]